MLYFVCRHAFQQNNWTACARDDESEVGTQTPAEAAGTGEDIQLDDNGNAYQICTWEWMFCIYTYVGIDAIYIYIYIHIYIYNLY